MPSRKSRNCRKERNRKTRKMVGGGVNEDVKEDFNAFVPKIKDALNHLDDEFGKFSIRLKTLRDMEIPEVEKPEEALATLKKISHEMDGLKSKIQRMELSLQFLTSNTSTLYKDLDRAINPLDPNDMVQEYGESYDDPIGEPHRRGEPPPRKRLVWTNPYGY